jgi:hypothetical protein
MVKSAHRLWWATMIRPGETEVELSHHGTLTTMRTKFLPMFLLVFGTLQAQNTLTTTTTQRYFNSVRRSLEASADVMPAEKYGFRLTDGQMTFAEWLIHSAQRNYADCATLKSESAPEAAKQLASLKEKAEVSKALKDSFAYCASVLETMDDQKVLSSPAMTYAFLHTVVHNNEIYGNVVGYLRVSGIVPPSTASRANQKKD